MESIEEMHGMDALEQLYLSDNKLINVDASTLCMSQFEDT